MTVGGMTQYLTKVQDMPKHIEKRLSKTIRTFIWGKKKQTPMKQETLLAPIDQGG